MSAPPWEVRIDRADAATLHGSGLPEPDRRLLRVAIAERPAIVLGSTQAATDVDDARAAALGLDVVRRRSGGGAVLVGPGDPLWVDVCLPKGDPLWLDDVGKAPLFVGRAWAEALGVDGLVVHDGAMCRTAFSRSVCWDGIGPGEVLTADHRKVVGISQRRGRVGAIFQCAAYARWAPGPLLDALAIEVDRAQVEGVGVGVDELGVDPDRLVGALSEALG